MNKPPAHESDRELRELIVSEQLHTSREHDHIVLSAARRFTQEGVTRRRRRAAAVWSLAAAFTAAVFVVLPLARPPERADSLRSASAGIERLIAPLDAVTLQAPPREFRWPAQAGVSVYRVVLRNAAAEVIWRSPDTADPAIEIDESVRASLTPQTYYWSLELVGIGAARTLGPFWFRLQPP